MKKTLLILLTFSTILFSCKVNKNLNNESKESGVELKDLIGNTYEFDYSKYIYHISIKSDSTIFWKLVEGEFEGVSEETDKYIYSKINDNIHFISWTEDSGLELFNVLNLENNTLSTHGKLDGYMFVNPGTVKLVE